MLYHSKTFRMCSTTFGQQSIQVFSQNKRTFSSLYLLVHHSISIVSGERPRSIPQTANNAVLFLASRCIVCMPCMRAQHSSIQHSSIHYFDTLEYVNVNALYSAQIILLFYHVFQIQCSVQFSHTQFQTQFLQEL